jgi:predicted nucleotidyltransferase
MFQNRDNMSLEIILVLLKGRMHVRGIAQKMGVPHTTVHRRVNELVTENVLDFRMEGKNKVVFLRGGFQARNHVLSAERYKFIKLLQTYPELNVILEEMLAKTVVELVVLFGSYAKFTAKKDSDIDVYAETLDESVRTEMESAHSKIRVKTGEFNPDSLLIKEIIKHHVILKGAERFYDKIEFSSAATIKSFP